MISDTLFMMLFVGLFISCIILALFIWGAKTGQFDDSRKMMDGLLFDNVDDLNDAIKKENKIKEAKEKKKQELDLSK
ncbi:MAG: cbb3-type cytochrome oxidase assembly protein CcoS [Campylobacteraceae bacterium]|nr:cbb3-type cytochrome oxidase assembly protein CcoS [Campylobacteraceae bacterium]